MHTSLSERLGLGENVKYAGRQSAHHRLCIREPLGIDTPGRWQTPPRSLPVKSHSEFGAEIFDTAMNVGISDVDRRVISEPGLLLGGQLQLVLWLPEKCRRYFRVI